MSMECFARNSGLRCALGTATHDLLFDIVIKACGAGASPPASHALIRVSERRNPFLLPARGRRLACIRSPFGRGVAPWCLQRFYASTLLRLKFTAPRRGRNSMRNGWESGKNRKKSAKSSMSLCHRWNRDFCFAMQGGQDARATSADCTRNQLTDAYVRGEIPLPENSPGSSPGLRGFAARLRFVVSACTSASLPCNGTNPARPRQSRVIRSECRLSRALPELASTADGQVCDYGAILVECVGQVLTAPSR